MFKLFADSGCDLPLSYMKENDITLIPLTYTLNGKEFTDDKSNEDLRPFYEQLRNGGLSITSQPSPACMREQFTKAVEEGDTVLFITFSSGISGTYQTAYMTAAELNEEYKEEKIIVVDSRCACGGCGMIVKAAVEMRNKGLSPEDVAKWLNENKLHFIHHFTVDSLSYLKRGGRVSAVTATIGGMLKLKPVLHVDNEGHLIKLGVVRGRRQSLNKIVESTIADMSEYSSEPRCVTICHGDVLDDAQYCAEELKKSPLVSSVVINDIGPVIGSHSGPGTLAIFSVGKTREHK